MKNKKFATLLLTGAMTTAVLAGPAAQAAQTLLTASPSAQKFYADGQQVRLEAYSINGYNYVKLADLSSLVGFDLAYDSTINDLIYDYEAQGLPVPPEEQLREEATAEARKCLETIMICEAQGHLWTERADPGNGCSDLTCRRCGTREHLQW